MVVQGRPLLERTVALVTSIIDDVYVSVRADQIEDRLRRQFRLIVDSQENLGPAAGFLAAHAEHPEVAWLVLACDLPLLDLETIRLLVRSRNVHRAATAYRSPEDGLPEPLCAIYEPDTLARFRHHAESGDSLSPRSLLANADVELLEPVGDRVLSNVNTPDDLIRLRTRNTEVPHE